MAINRGTWVRVCVLAKHGGRNGQNVSHCFRVRAGLDQATVLAMMNDYLLDLIEQEYEGNRGRIGSSSDYTLEILPGSGWIG